MVAKLTKIFNMNTEQEIWKAIIGYEGLYEVSHTGKVKSIDRNVEFIQFGKQKKQKIKGKILKWSFTRGYPKVTLSKNGIKKDICVHLLVWDAFGEGQRDGFKLQVDHIDENKKNPIITNLRLATNRQNSTYYCLNNKKNGLPLGVIYCRNRNRPSKYSSQIRIKGKTKYLGFFLTSDLAGEAYKKALKTLVID